MGTINKLLGSVVAVFIILMGLPVAMAVYQGSFTQQEFDTWLLNPEVQASIHSDAANTDDLGSTTREWRDLYLGDSGNILWGNAQDVDLGRSGANTLTLATGDTLAITSAGSLTVAGNAVADIGGFTMSGGNINAGGNSVTVVNTLSGSNNVSSLTINGWVTGAAPAQRDLVFATGNAANPQALVPRLTIGSNAATSVITFANATVAGLNLGTGLLSGTDGDYDIGDSSHFAAAIYVRTLEGMSTLKYSGGTSLSIEADAGVGLGTIDFKTGDSVSQVLRSSIGASGGVGQSATNTWTLTNQDFGTNFVSFTETAAPGAGGADTARIYAIVDGGALTDLAAVFQDGTVDIFAQEVTPLNAPTFRYADKTAVIVELRKPHPGIVSFVVVFPDGTEFPLREYNYHDPVKIAANKGTASSLLPIGWVVESASQRATRLDKEKVK